MKKFGNKFNQYYLILTMIFSIYVIPVQSQSPDAFYYQAQLRDVAGNILENENITTRISLLENSTTGNIAYSEVHSVNTNVFGIISEKTVFASKGGATMVGQNSNVNCTNATRIVRIIILSHFFCFAL